MSTYDVTVTREDGLWVADIHDLSPAATDVLSFAELGTEVRDLIAGLTDADPDDFEIRWRYALGDERLNALLPSLERLNHCVHERETVRQEVVERLVRAGHSQRTAADVVGLSHQRVHQLVKS